MSEQQLLALIEFPADDPERALRFWRGLLGVDIDARAEGDGRLSLSFAAPKKLRPGRYTLVINERRTAAARTITRLTVTL